MTRTLDALLKLDELQSLLGSGDADKLHDAARRAQVALGFRATDAMLGLEPVGEDVLARLGAAVRAALREAAALGVHDAACELARMHMADGDLDGAFAVVVAAAEAGHAEGGNVRAMGNLGGFYATGSGVERDPARAVEWYERAAQLGHGRSAATLGTMYATGDGVAVAPEQARLWFRAADDLGFDWRDMAEAVGLDVDAWDDAFAGPMGLD